VFAYVYKTVPARRILSELAAGAEPQEKLETDQAAADAAIKSLALAVPIERLSQADSTSMYILQNYCRFH